MQFSLVRPSPPRERWVHSDLFVRTIADQESQHIILIIQLSNLDTTKVNPVNVLNTHVSSLTYESPFDFAHFEQN